MAKTQKNKKTEYHLGRLKGTHAVARTEAFLLAAALTHDSAAQLAKLRTQLLEPAPGTSSKAGDGFEARRCMRMHPPRRVSANNS